MSEPERDPVTCMVKVGEAAPIPRSPVGDIWVSETLIARVGIDEVRRRVREIYAAAFWRHAAAKRRKG